MHQSIRKLFLVAVVVAVTSAGMGLRPESALAYRAAQTIDAPFGMAVITALTERAAVLRASPSRATTSSRTAS